MIFDKKQQKGTIYQDKKNVLSIDASKDYVAGKNQNNLSDEHLQKIFTTYKNRQNIDKYAHLASFEQIQENEFNLNIPRYVDTFEEQEEIDILALQTEIDELERELSQIKIQMQEKLKELEEYNKE